MLRLPPAVPLHAVATADDLHYRQHPQYPQHPLHMPHTEKSRGAFKRMRRGSLFAVSDKTAVIRRFGVPFAEGRKAVEPRRIFIDKAEQIAKFRSNPQKRLRAPHNAFT